MPIDLYNYPPDTPYNNLPSEAEDSSSSDYLNTYQPTDNDYPDPDLRETEPPDNQLMPEEADEPDHRATDPSSPDKTNLTNEVVSLDTMAKPAESIDLPTEPIHTNGDRPITPPDIGQPAEPYTPPDTDPATPDLVPTQKDVGINSAEAVEEGSDQLPQPNSETPKTHLHSVLGTMVEVNRDSVDKKSIDPSTAPKAVTESGDLGPGAFPEQDISHSTKDEHRDSDHTYDPARPIELAIPETQAGEGGSGAGGGSGKGTGSIEDSDDPGRDNRYGIVEQNPEDGQDSKGPEYVDEGRARQTIWKAIERCTKDGQKIYIDLPDGRRMQVTIEPRSLDGGIETPEANDQNSQSIGDRLQTAVETLKALQISPYNHPDVYEALGINLKRLAEGVVIQIEPLDIISHVPGGADDLYYSTDKSFPFFAGPVGEVMPHVTLGYGFMRPPSEIRPLIDEVLEGWSPESVTIEGITYYTSRIETEPFYCIAGEVQQTANLLEGYARLNLIPHANMYPNPFAPHVSLAYIKQDPEVLDKWLRHLSDHFVGRRLPVRSELSYGR